MKTPMRYIALLALLLLSTAVHAQTTFDTGTARRIAPSTYSGLGTPVNGEVRQCSDCTKTDPTAAGGTGALVKANGVKWYSIEGTGGGGGTGNVVGPSSSVNNRLAVFGDTTGKVLADGGVTIADLQTLDPDLSDIAALTPVNDDIIQRKSGAWTNRSLAQYRLDLLPTQSGQAGKYLKTDGSVFSWDTPAGAGTVTNTGTLTANKLMKGNGTTDITPSKVTITDPTTTATVVFGTDNSTLTFQGTGTVVNRDSTDTLSGKSISGLANTITNLAASVIVSGAIDTARLGSGVADSTTVLWGDQTWRSGIGDVNSNTSTSIDGEFMLFSATGGKTARRATGNGLALSTNGVYSAVNTSAGIAGAVSDETGSGALVFGTTPTLGSPILTTPTVASFVNAAHDHTNAAGGGQLTISAFSSTTGSGAVVGATSPTLVTPTIASLTNAQHTHANAAGGGQLTIAAFSSSTGTGAVVAGTSPTIATPALTLRTQADNTAIVANSPYRNTGDGKLYIGAADGSQNREIFVAGESGPISPINGGRGLVGSGANVASAAAIVPTGNLFHLTGTTNVTSITSTGINAGTVITIIFDDVLTFTDGSNLKLAGNFVTTADDTITLQFDGTNWYEMSRSIN